jgi:hypothetical protein
MPLRALPACPGHGRSALRAPRPRAGTAVVHPPTLKESADGSRPSPLSDFTARRLDVQQYDSAPNRSSFADRAHSRRDAAADASHRKPPLMIPCAIHGEKFQTQYLFSAANLLSNGCILGAMQPGLVDARACGPRVHPTAFEGPSPTVLQIPIPKSRFPLSLSPSDSTKAT